MKNLETAYLKLNTSTLTEQDWFDLSAFFRLDPRFFEAAVLKFSEDFKNLNPINLNILFQQSKQPSLIGLVVDLAGLINKTTQFKTFKKMLSVQIKKSPLQVFYINLHPVKPKHLLELVLKSNSTFRKWGYAEIDLPINKSFSIKNHTSVSKNIRNDILAQLLRNKKRIRTIDYIQELQSKGYTISQRVAELDLKSCLKLKSHDQTKGRYYLVKT